MHTPDITKECVIRKCGIPIIMIGQMVLSFSFQQQRLTGQRGYFLFICKSELIYWPGNSCRANPTIFIVSIISYFILWREWVNHGWRMKRYMIPYIRYVFLPPGSLYAFLPGKCTMSCRPKLREPSACYVCFGFGVAIMCIRYTLTKSHPPSLPLSPSLLLSLSIYLYLSLPPSFSTSLSLPLPASLPLTALTRSLNSIVLAA